MPRLVKVSHHYTSPCFKANKQHVKPHIAQNLVHLWNAGWTAPAGDGTRQTFYWCLMEEWPKLEVTRSCTLIGHSVRVPQELTNHVQLKKRQLFVVQVISCSANNMSDHIQLFARLKRISHRFVFCMLHCHWKGACVQSIKWHIVTLVWC